MKDKYKILDITEKSKTEFQIAYSVESGDVPYFKAMVSGPASEDMNAILERVRDAAYIQLTNRREKIAKEVAKRTEEENQKIHWDNLKKEIENIKQKEITLKKPVQKRKRLESPNGEGKASDEE